MKHILSSHVLKVGLALAFLLATVLGALPALASGPIIESYNNTPATYLPAGDYCPNFGVQFTPLTADETRKTFSIQGYTMKLITGPLSGQFTNASTGYTLTFNMAGPERLVIAPDGRSIQLVGNWILWDSPLNGNGLPPISLTQGQLLVTIDATGLNYTFSGTMQNVCDLLNH